MAPRQTAAAEEGFADLIFGAFLLYGTIGSKSCDEWDIAPLLQSVPGRSVYIYEYSGHAPVQMSAEEAPSY